MKRRRLSVYYHNLFVPQRRLLGGRRNKHPACYRSLALGSVNATQEKFENTALFLPLGMPSTLIRHENEVFQKRYSNGKNLKTPAFRFRADRKHSENGAFPQRQH